MLNVIIFFIHILIISRLGKPRDVCRSLENGVGFEHLREASKQARLVVMTKPVSASGAVPK